jgi:hypothetical protein
MPEPCRLCNTRRPKRRCPGIEGDICAPCCGDQREVTISCPLDCSYLREARLHEKPAEVDRAAVPNPDIRLNDDWLHDHEELVLFSLFTFADAALRTPGAVDSDILAAVEALIRTYRTLDAGLVYETKPDDRVAAAVQEQFERSLADFQKQRAEKEGRSHFRPAEILGCLAFVQRTGLVHRNHRPRSRAFIDFIRSGLAGFPVSAA